MRIQNNQFLKVLMILVIVCVDASGSIYTPTSPSLSSSRRTTSPAVSPSTHLFRSQSRARKSLSFQALAALNPSSASASKVPTVIHGVSQQTLSIATIPPSPSLPPSLHHEYETLSSNPSNENQNIVVLPTADSSHDTHTQNSALPLPPIQASIVPSKAHEQPLLDEAPSDYHSPTATSAPILTESARRALELLQLTKKTANKHEVKISHKVSHARGSPTVISHTEPPQSISKTYQDITPVIDVTSLTNAHASKEANNDVIILNSIVTSPLPTVEPSIPQYTHTQSPTHPAPIVVSSPLPDDASLSINDLTRLLLDCEGDILNVDELLELPSSPHKHEDLLAQRQTLVTRKTLLEQQILVKKETQILHQLPTSELKRQIKDDKSKLFDLSEKLITPEDEDEAQHHIQQLKQHLHALEDELHTRDEHAETLLISDHTPSKTYDAKMIEKHEPKAKYGKIYESLVDKTAAPIMQNDAAKKSYSDAKSPIMMMKKDETETLLPKPVYKSVDDKQEPKIEPAEPISRQQEVAEFQEQFVEARKTAASSLTGTANKAPVAPSTSFFGPTASPSSSASNSPQTPEKNVKAVTIMNSFTPVGANVFGPGIGVKKKPFKAMGPLESPLTPHNFMEPGKLVFVQAPPLTNTPAPTPFEFVKLDMSENIQDADLSLPKLDLREKSNLPL